VCVPDYGHTAMNVNVDNNCGRCVTPKSRYFSEVMPGLPEVLNKERGLWLSLPAYTKNLSGQHWLLISERSKLRSQTRTAARDMITALLIYSSYCNRVPPLWSSGQSSWLQIRRPVFDSRRY
jgi:hypothetical protein